MLLLIEQITESMKTFFKWVFWSTVIILAIVAAITLIVTVPPMFIVIALLVYIALK